MRTSAAMLLCTSFACSNTSAAPPSPAPLAAKPAPERPAVQAPSFAVVELFTSEGCSSCPPAEAVLHDVGESTGVIALAFHVDYWNGSWTDRFSSEKITSRQSNYADVLGNGLYTPEMVVNGRTQFVGSNRNLAKARIADALATAPRATLTLTAKRDSKSRLSVTWTSTPPLAGTNVVVALTEGDLVVTPKAGELEGQTLHHDHVVRAFTTADASSGTGTLTLSHPADVHIDKSKLVAFLQESSQRTIVAATRVPSP
ncbi:MAG: DUF1223 domain-containing protein [Polyangiales bacterium]